MSEQGYERKKDFVNHALSRCVASMYPNVCRVAYCCFANKLRKFFKQSAKKKRRLKGF